MNIKKGISVFLLTLFSCFGFSVVQAQDIGSLRAVVTPGFSFAMDLKPGYTDQDVLELQRVLNADADTTVALDGEGSHGHETKYFGNKTKQAVIKFQEKYRDTILTPSGLTNGTGVVGKSTRTKLNLLVGVMNTMDSVGSPESSGVTTTPTTPVAVTQPSMSVCSFVELLINIQAISASKAPQARNLLGCDGAPRVELSINNRTSDITIGSPRNLTVKWTASGVSSCVGPSGIKPISGSEHIYVDESRNYVISCAGKSGTVTDSINIRLDNGDDIASTTPDIATSTQELNVTCFSNPPVAKVGEPVYLFAVPEPNDSPFGTYVYSWTGDDGLSRSGQNVTFTYYTPGTKVANISLSHGTTTVTSSCDIEVEENSGLIDVASSTMATTTDPSLTTPFPPFGSWMNNGSNQSSLSGLGVDAEATDLDKVLFLSPGLDCASPLQNFYYTAYSLTDYKPVTYVWIEGKSEYIDNLGGAIIGNILSQEDNTADATFTTPGAQPGAGEIMDIVIGDKVKCTVYGDTKVILRGYKTVQGEDWVKDQEQSNSSGGSL